MAQINVNNLSFHYEGSYDNIFENVSFSIDTNWKLGFLGRNGKGKTTFLNLLLGKYEYMGSIGTNTAFDYFPYQIKKEFLKMTVMEFLQDMKPGCEEWRVICEVNKLYLDAEVLFRNFGTLSPGEQVKVMLAILFSGENEFLLIDEPTNHLDQETRETVKKYLSMKKGFILVSHDRDLLDACVNHMLVLNRTSIEVQSGNFTSWWENKTKKDAFVLAENEKHRKEISKLNKALRRTKDWADQNEKTKIGFDPVKEHDRFLDTRCYIGAKTKKMQSRVKQMENRMEREIQQNEGLLQDIESVADLKLQPLKFHTERIILLEKYGLQYRDGKQSLFQNISFTVKQGDRVFLNGGNGSGKSSLLKMIMHSIRKEDVIETGLLQVPSGLVISYISQDTSFLHGTLQHFCRERKIEVSLMCSILCQLAMDSIQFTKPMENYSEGQKKKVLIAASLLTPAHLYIWDEPLNYIDIYARMQLEKLVSAYQPTMLVVEHDIRFREQIATQVISMEEYR